MSSLAVRMEQHKKNGFLDKESNTVIFLKKNVVP